MKLKIGRLTYKLNQNSWKELSELERQEAFWRIERLNFIKLRIIGAVAIVLESLLIVFNDLPDLQKPHYDQALTLSYLALHGILLGLSIGVVWLGRRPFPELGSPRVNRYAWINGIFGMLFLSGIGIITGLDQLTNGQIVSFIGMFTIASLVYSCRPPRQLLVLGLPMAVFALAVLHFQKDPVVAAANVINGLTFAVTMAFVSVFQFKREQNEFAREILLESWTEKLNFLAHHDPLTGLYNRRSFEAEVQSMSEHCSSHQCYALGIMDLDHFKKLNDVFGHDAADEVLIRVAQNMAANIAPLGIVARWGGEEFIFMMWDESFERLVERTEALRRALEDDEILIGQQRVLVTGSFGLTQVQCHEFSQLKEKFSIVDKALYEAKESGRNQLVVR